MPRRSRQFAALAISVLALAGCQGGADPNAAPSTTAPTTAAPSTATPTAGASPSCNHPPDTGGGDGGLGVGLDYTESHHDFGASAPFALCMDLEDDEVFRVTGSSPEVTVTPEALPGPGTRFTFTVTVHRGATGGLDVELGGEAGGGGMTFNGPAIVTDETGWNFGP
ncbi:hypothetical protein [Cellulomonas sp. KRMCY2]|uniref:hypothetical protein n=1 Tax=Cellulomonas sp. KRMCY2 TaxID=1304865 RepID=UPI00045EB4A8|nr:hypothetical protein [Cellulomonas sp. KRMCY2]